MTGVVPDKAPTLASYVAPPAVARAAAGPLDTATATEGEAVVLFADVSGFTRLAEALAAEGASASERLSNALNGYFGEVIDCIDAHGGEVYDFAGDAVIAVWDAGRDASGALAAASACALRLVRTLADRPAAGGHRLSLRASVGAGTLCSAMMPGARDRWFFVAAGPALQDAIDAQRNGAPGEALMSAAAFAALGGAATGTALADGSVRLTGISAPDASPASAASPRARGATAFPPEVALRRFVPEPVLEALDAGSPEWRAELRRVTVMFVRLDGLHHGVGLGSARVQDAIRRVDEVLHRHGGSIGQFVVDDKGTVVVAAWGLPGSTHENNAARTIEAAETLHATLGEAGIACGIGVASGRVFCGDRGSALRREYAVVGATVIRAARLMGVARGATLCDDDTRVALATQRAGSGMTLEPAGELRLKGVAAPVPVFRPDRRAAPAAGRAATTSDPGPMVGRDAERAAIAGAIGAWAAKPATTPAVVIVEGEAGIGKSRLLGVATTLATGLGVRVLAGAASPGGATAYHAWRGVFESIFPMEAQVAARVDAVRARLAQLAPDSDELLPLLNPVLGTELPDTTLTAQMQGEARSHVVTGLLAKILRSDAAAHAAAHGAPTMLRMEDAHWFDSASWMLLATVRRDVPSVLIAMTMRPIDPPLPRGYDAVCAPPATRVRPGAFSRDDVGRLAALRLKVDAVDGEILDFIFTHGGGNPFFTEEMAFALRDAGELETRGGRAALRSRRTPLAQLVPATVEGTVAMRIDRLGQEAQLALKVASVIAREFTLEALEACYPVAVTRTGLRDALRTLEGVDLVSVAADEADPVFAFRHAITQQVAYDLLPFAQRRSLHFALATWYERTRADNLGAIYDVLAHHFAASETVDKAIHYLDKAGRQAVQTDANHEAVSLLERAAAMQARPGAPAADSAAIAERDYALAEACRRLGRIPDAERYLRSGLARIGRRIPTGRVGLVGAILSLAADQVTRRKLGRRRADLDDGAQARGRLAFACFDRFTRIAFLNMQTDLTVFSTLSCLAEAERLGPSPELASAYAAMCGAAGLVPHHGIARSYEQRFLDTVAAVAGDGALSHAFALEAVALYNCGIGAWDRADRYLRRSRELFERYGDRSEEAVVLQMLSRSLSSLGRFAEIQAVADRMMELSRPRDAIVEQTWSVNNSIEVQLQTGEDLRACEELCEVALGLLDASGEVSARALTRGLQATVRCRAGDFAGAEDAANHATTILAGMQPTSYGMLIAYATAAWSWLDCWEQAASAGDAAAVSRIAARAAVAQRQLEALARVFPIARPRAALVRARAGALRGHTARAARDAREGLAAAERLGMPYEIMLARMSLATMDALTRPARAAHAAAAAVAAGIGAVYDGRRAERLRAELAA